MFDWALWLVRADCCSQAALSSNDSKTLYLRILILYTCQLPYRLTANGCPTHVASRVRVFAFHHRYDDRNCRVCQYGVVPAEYGRMRGSLLHSCMPSYVLHIAALRHCSLTFGAMLKCCTACEYTMNSRVFFGKRLFNTGPEINLSIRFGEICFCCTGS